MTRIPKASEKLTLSDIKQGFPLPGSYIFRFKSRYNKTAVFMDVLKESDRLPHFDQKIVMKVTRLGFGGAKRSSLDVSGLLDSHPKPAAPAPKPDANNMDFAPL